MRRARTELEMTEWTQVERPLINQLAALDWEWLQADEEDEAPSQTGRPDFKHYILEDILRQRINEINDPDETGWIGDEQFEQIMSEIQSIPSHDLIEANLIATDFLREGITIKGDDEFKRGEFFTIKLIDFDDVESNHFQLVNQLKMVPEWYSGERGVIYPDIVLFVNGIPLVVIECKGRGIQQPMFSGIDQLRRYQNVRGGERPEGAPQLFTFVQIVISTFMLQARYASVGSEAAYFQSWNDAYPYTDQEVSDMVGVSREPFAQERMVAGMLNKASLLGLIRNTMLHEESEDDVIKIAPRYPQKRAVEKVIRRLRGEDLAHPEARGGVVWHTQGSGKSMTMGCIARAIMNHPDLHDHKIVFMTDRTNLEKQLKDSPAFSGRRVRPARSIAELREILSEDGPDLIFGMIQKAKERLDTEDADVVEYTDNPDAPETQSFIEQVDGRSRKRLVLREDTLPRLNSSEKIVVIADEAHRTHTGTLHRALRTALPNAAFIGFTGTPIMDASRATTAEIFGPEIDRYTIDQAEADGLILPTKYEGREIDLFVDEDIDENLTDQLRQEIEMVLEQQGRVAPDEEIEEMIGETIKRDFSRSALLALPTVIRRKARDIVEHYSLNIMVDGFKAQVVAVSRHAAVCYQVEITNALQELVAELEGEQAQSLIGLGEDGIDQLEGRNQFLARVVPHLALIRSLEASTVISKRHNDHEDINVWSTPSLQSEHIERFKRPLIHSEEEQRDGMAFLCVNKMLTTGFNAPIEKVMYLDKRMEGHELLQTIARVNRLYPHKEFGLVVDYNALQARFLEAREIYTSEGIDVEFSDIVEECLQNLGPLEDEMYAFFAALGVEDIEDLDDIDQCVLLLVDDEARAEFHALLTQFLRFLNRVAYRPDTSQYRLSARIFSHIYRDACNLVNEENLIIAGLGHIVRSILVDSVHAGEIEMRVPPISLSDDEFEDYLQTLRSNRAMAQAMQFAIQHHITLHMDDAPITYAGLQDRLDDIISRYHDDWDNLVAFLEEIMGEALAGIASLDIEGLEPLQVPLLHIIVGDGDHDEADLVVVRTCWEIIQQNIVLRDFRRNEESTEALRRQLWRQLRTHVGDSDVTWGIASDMADYAVRIC